MNRPHRPAAIVLAGGTSSRMGADKATLVVDGRRMIDRVIDAVVQADVTNITVSGPDPGGLDSTVTVVGDPPGPRQGPMAGVVTAWLARRVGDPVVVLAVDTVAPVAATVAEVVAHGAQAEWGAVTHDGERPQPLYGAYRPAFLDLLAARFSTGERSIRRVFADLDMTVLATQPSLIRDADRPEDLVDHRVEWPPTPGTADQ